jgi:hypothetical protein
MKKSIFMLFLILILAGCQEEDEPVEAEPAVTGKSLQLDTAEFRVKTPQFSLENETVSESSLLSVYTDTVYQYDLTDGEDEAGKLMVKIREIDNGDQLVFIQLEGLKEVSAHAELTFNETNRAELMDWDQRFVDRPHDKNTGEDKSTQPIGLFKLSQFEDPRCELVLSKGHLSSLLVENYGEGLSSHVRVLEEESKEYSVEQSNDAVRISLELSAEKGKVAEQWFMVSDQSLFASEKELQSWIDYQLDSYKEANGWLTAGGPMKKLPWSIEPFTKEGYGRNLGVMVDREAIDRYIKTKERYYYNLMVNSAADLYEYRQEKDTEIWETEYTSTWLKDAYGLTAPYIDTRHNEFISLYLGKIGTELDLPELLSAKLNYADYLLGQIEIGNVIKAGDGLLISDYFSPYDQNQKTHASMNHVLGGANLLLESYQQSGEEKYLEAAKKIRRAIENLGTSWIRESGDLWYQVNPDLTFAGNDYKQLTLVDLLKHQKKWESIGESRSELIDQLIFSKVGYLAKEKVNLLDEVKAELKIQGLVKP